MEGSSPTATGAFLDFRGLISAAKNGGYKNYQGHRSKYDFVS